MLFCLALFAALEIHAQILPQEELLRQRIDGLKIGSSLLAPPSNLAVVPRVDPQEQKPSEQQEKAPDIDTGRLLEDVDFVRKLAQGIHPNAHTNKKLRDAAVEGMLRALDPHSYLLRPEAFKRLLSRQESSYVGVGMLVLKPEPEEPILIQASFPGGPAFRAGIKGGDRIVSVNGQDVFSMSLDEAVSFIRGEPGSTVKLGIISKGSDPRAPPKKKEVELLRARVESPSIRSAMLEEEIGYIHLIGFEINSSPQFAKALADLRSQGMKSLVIDLRDNPGGYLDSVVEISGNFLKKDQLIVSEKFRSVDSPIFEDPRFEKSIGPFQILNWIVQEREYHAKLDGQYQDLKIAVLINARSASASEVLAGALQDHGRDSGRVVLVGSRSFGKGSVQTHFENIPEPGYAVYMTVAKYYLPSGRWVQKDENGKGGLTPDIEVKVAPDDDFVLMQQLISKFYQEDQASTPVKDEVLDRALEHLRGQLAQAK